MNILTYKLVCVRYYLLPVFLAPIPKILIFSGFGSFEGGWLLILLSSFSVLYSILPLVGGGACCHPGGLCTMMHDEGSLLHWFCVLIFFRQTTEPLLLLILELQVGIRYVHGQEVLSTIYMNSTKLTLSQHAAAGCHVADRSCGSVLIWRAVPPSN